MSPDGVMPLPDLKELAKKTRKKDRQKQATEVTREVLLVWFACAGMICVCLYDLYAVHLIFPRLFAQGALHQNKTQ